ncbi:MAG: hypothetical protein LBP78_05405 [Acidaminococcales bacterium]|jgi:hypothetical protein|nr:hypothetical protein [Acidaminococcales bacterium]
MATSSILKNVNIKDKHLAQKLVNALENAKNKQVKDVAMRHPVEDVKGEKLKQLFKG